MGRWGNGEMGRWGRFLLRVDLWQKWFSDTVFVVNYCPRFPIPYSRFPIPDSRFPIPDSRFPIPDSRFPTPDSLN
ncbi:MAG: hypothetical protein F6K50_45675 [Moorea sp. SIO3I7]|nr:hypothetical protein [Moorena sp. SIO3I7]NEO47740.1 hypothetical protein [Moorena sp. SIO4A3]